MKKLKLTLASFAFGALLMAAPITALAQCSSGFITTDGTYAYNCYLVGEDTDWCYYECESFGRVTRG